MRFVLRMAFWLTVILASLPSGGSQPTPKLNVSPIDAMWAAKATVTDMGSFCERQPDACTVGSHDLPLEFPAVVHRMGAYPNSKA